jgi:methylated-DNA-[protein]-cysteine S-methyltransferase
MVTIIAGEGLKRHLKSGESRGFGTIAAATKYAKSSAKIAGKVVRAEAMEGLPASRASAAPPAWLESETGGLRLRLTAGPAGLRSVEFSPETLLGGTPDPGHPVLVEAHRQLCAYFAGELRRFELPLEFVGTPFQQSVWRALLEIPYGETRSYGQLAQSIGLPAAVRAVGAANGANPLAIVVPCHRVIGASGKLVGYAGGLPLKRRLLALERGSLFEA